MRKLATIQRIAALSPIPGADKIEVATILGWQVVVKKGEFKVGDPCVYIEIDSIVPDHPLFEFLRERKFRVRTIKLRKQVSQGLALPVPAVSYYIRKVADLSIGDDATDIIGIKKYDPQAEVEAKLFEVDAHVAKSRLGKFLNRYAWYRRLLYKPKRLPFPKFIAKTDETRIQNIPGILNQLKGCQCTATEKLDGQSATYFVVKKKTWFGTKLVFGVCSRNFQLLQEDNSSYWTIARQLRIHQVLIDLLNASPKTTEFIVLQGEIIGKNIQGNKYKIDGYEFFAFNLKFNDRSVPSELIHGHLWGYGIFTVPVLADFYLPNTVQDLVNLSKGNSVIGAKPIREGLVIRNHKHKTSFKVINPDFLLHNVE